MWTHGTLVRRAHDRTNGRLNQVADGLSVGFGVLAGLPWKESKIGCQAAGVTSRKWYRWIRGRDSSVATPPEEGQGESASHLHEDSIPGRDIPG